MLGSLSSTVKVLSMQGPGGAPVEVRGQVLRVLRDVRAEGPRRVVRQGRGEGEKAGRVTRSRLVPVAWRKALQKLF